MKNRLLVPLYSIILLLVASTGELQTQQLTYFPGPGKQWETRSPGQLGMDPALLDSAVQFSITNESKWARDLAEELPRAFSRQPNYSIIGPTKERGPSGGIILRHGYIVAEWGETERVDMSFSVAKSFVSTMAGIAFDRGLIRDMHDRVREYVNDGGFDSDQNRSITWHMLLQQTSEWEGNLFGKSDSSDRRRGYTRSLHPAGTFWEYNDVRVNRASLSILRVLNEPLPAVLKRDIMDPIGASSTWVWHGYFNSEVDVAGKKIISVTGGGHWGGGIWISTRDLARFGYLFLRNGRWNDRQLISERWINMALTPCELRPVYGYMWWLNTEKQQWPAATEGTYAALGAGNNAVVVVPEYDLVLVVRWIDNPKLGEFIGTVVKAVVR